jgi:regulator of protease activity HflC (stomatin/prohibitin superfamily)
MYAKIRGERGNFTIAQSVGMTITGALAVLWFLCVNAVAPDQSHEYVLVKQPILPFFSQGVDPNPVKTGRTYVMRSTKAVKVNVQPTQYPIHFDDLMTSDGVPLKFDSVIRLRVTDSVALIKNFGVDWYDNNIKNEFMNRVRQSVRNHGMNETAIDSRAIDAIDKEVTTAMNEYIKAAKIPVQLMMVTIGKANPPDSIKTQRVETAAQQQRILTEHQRKLAEDSRKAAEQSRAAADNVYREAMGLNPSQYLQLEHIKMLKEVGAKGGNSFIVGGGVTPVIDLKK